LPPRRVDVFSLPIAMRLFPVLNLTALAAAVAFVACQSAEPTAPAVTSPSAAAAASVPEPSTMTTGPSVSLPADDAPATAACGWSDEHPEVANWRTLIQSDDPSFGPASARVTVVEFFEPNCPHCQHLHPTIRMVQRAFPNVRFVYKPVVFWPVSITQTQALYAAQAEGKFEAMLDAQMDAAQQGGLQEEQVRALASRVGMNADALMQRIEAGTYRTKMMGNRADFGATGINTVPLVLINGKVMGSDRTTGCFGQLIRQQGG